MEQINHATYCEYRKAYDAGVRNNEHTGKIAQYEALNYRPPVIVAYIGGKVGDGMGCDRFGATSRVYVTTWTGDAIGHAGCSASWSVRSHYGSRMHQYHAIIGGAHYTGRGLGKGMSVVLKRCYRSNQR